MAGARGRAGAARVCLALAERRGADPAARGWLVLRLGLLRRHADSDRGIADVDAAIALGEEAGDPLLAAYARFQAGNLRSYRRDYPTALAMMEAALAELAALPPLDDAMRARLRGWGLADDPAHHRGTLSEWYSWAGRYADALAIGEPVVAHPPPTGAHWLDGAFAPDALRGIGQAHAALGRPAEGRAAIERHLAACLAAGDLGQAAVSTTLLLWRVVLPYQADDLAERRRLAGEIVRLWGRASATWVGAPWQQYGWPLLFVEGNWAALRASPTPVARDAHDWGERLEARLQLAFHQGAYSEGHMLLRVAAPEGAMTAPQDCQTVSGLALRPLAAALALATDDLPTAQAWLEAHDRWLAWSGSVLFRAEGARGWAAYHRAAGDPVAAREHAARALAHASEPRQPLALLAAHRLLGELDTEMKQLGAAAEHFDAALTLADACAAPYERALTLLARAELALATRDRAGAVTALEESRTILVPLEARPALARAEALTTRLGVARALDPGVRSYPADLTPREAEVLRLVAAGLTDAQVAARLHRSPRTVHHHLRAIYSKLGVASRSAATRFAIEHHLA